MCAYKTARRRESTTNSSNDDSDDNKLFQTFRSFPRPEDAPSSSSSDRFCALPPAGDRQIGERLRHEPIQQLRLDVVRGPRLERQRGLRSERTRRLQERVQNRDQEPIDNDAVRERGERHGPIVRVRVARRRGRGDLAGRVRERAAPERGGDRQQSPGVRAGRRLRQFERDDARPVEQSNRRDRRGRLRQHDRVAHDRLAKQPAESARRQLVRRLPQVAQSHVRGQRDRGGADARVQAPRRPPQVERRLRAGDERRAERQPHQVRAPEGVRRPRRSGPIVPRPQFDSRVGRAHVRRLEVLQGARLERQPLGVSAGGDGQRARGGTDLPGGQSVGLRVLGVDQTVRDREEAQRADAPRGDRLPIGADQGDDRRDRRDRRAARQRRRREEELEDCPLSHLSRDFALIHAEINSCLSGFSFFDFSERSPPLECC